VDRMPSRPEGTAAELELVGAPLERIADGHRRHSRTGSEGTAGPQRPKSGSAAAQAAPVLETDLTPFPRRRPPGTPRMRITLDSGNLEQDPWHPGPIGKVISRLPNWRVRSGFTRPPRPPAGYPSTPSTGKPATASIASTSTRIPATWSKRRIRSRDTRSARRRSEEHTSELQSRENLV